LTLIIIVVSIRDIAVVIERNWHSIVSLNFKNVIVFLFNTISF